MTKSASVTASTAQAVKGASVLEAGETFMPEIFQTADWKKEKHIPVIELPAMIHKGEYFQIVVTVGKEINHPNKTEHHILWIDVYFRPDGESFLYQIGKAEFGAHGASTQGPDTSTIYTKPEAFLSFKTDKPGILHAFALCNIHGLWQSSRPVEFKPA
jgi:superoxide reductase